MKCFLSAAILTTLLAAGTAQSADITFEKLTLSDKFLCEGAYYGDFNRDGAMDVVSGPYWYAGPDFKNRHEIRPAKEYDPKGYSDNFLTYTGDFNGDQWTDILFVPWPGKDASWYENPAGKEGPWKEHPCLKNVGNESPVWGDITGDGRPELAFNIDGFLGYGIWDPAKPNEPWTFTKVSTQGNYQRYTHGVGIGDINGDGRTDLLEGGCWWEQPANPKPNEPWPQHPFKFADAAAQMLVDDIDGDGLNDVVTSWHCHLYGLVWYKQLRDDDGKITFEQNVILPIEPNMESDDLRISQLHAFDLVDMNNDGLLDFVTGKRFWAHGPTGDKEPNAPAVVYWFELQRTPTGPKFIPHLIDDKSGVGTQVATAKLNADSIPDVIVGNKKGTFVFLSK